MKLLVFGGFLGSGKTTLLLEIIQGLKEKYSQIAIIENEVGQIGIDGKYLQANGLNVQELFGGCICCTLTTNMIETIQTLEKEYHPSLIIIEATGVARPGDIVATIAKELPKETETKALAVIDAKRYRMLCDMMEPVITDQIHTADIVVINKIDQVDERELAFILQDAKRYNDQVMMFPLSLSEKTNLEDFKELFMKEI